MKKKYLRYCQIGIAIFMLFLTIDSALANHYDEEDVPDKWFFGSIFDDLTDAVMALPRLLLDLVLEIVNAPVKPLLSFIKILLGESVNTSIFKSLWSIIVYVLSFFFSLSLVFCSFNFMISGHDVEKREKAKDWLKNTLILIVLLPSSYWIYSLILEFSAGLTGFVINLIRPEFFLITANNIGDASLSLALTLPYLIILMLTSVVLIVRYALISIGVVLFPTGLFLYFIPPLRSYGSFIINFLMINIFVGFFNALLLLAFYKLIELPVFGSLKILVVISGFFVIDIITLFAMIFSLLKAAFSIGKNVVNPIISVGKYFV